MDLCGFPSTDAPGARLLFFTDGITEAENDKDEEFGNRGIAGTDGSDSSPATQLKNKIMRVVEKFCHGKFPDDVTLVVLCIRRAQEELRYTVLRE